MEQIGFHYPENQFPPARVNSVFKNWFPLITVTVSTCRKKLSIKVTVSIIGKNPSPIATMKASFKTKFPLDRKKLFPAGVSSKIYLKNGFY